MNSSSPNIQELIQLRKKAKKNVRITSPGNVSIDLKDMMIMSLKICLSRARVRVLKDFPDPQKQIGIPAS